MQDTIKQSIDTFFSAYPKFSLKKESTIIQPEEPILYIYNLVSGYVKSYSINDNGLELTINIYKPYNIFPITETLAGKTNTYFFEAITDVVLQKAPTQDVHKYIQSDAEVLFDLTKRISSGLEGFMIRTQYLIRSNSTQKVAASLALLARRFGETTPDRKIKILIPQTHTDISNLSGVSRETASIELKKLETDRIISYKKQNIVVNDFKRLSETSTIYNGDTPLSFSF